MDMDLEDLFICVNFITDDNDRLPVRIPKNSLSNKFSELIKASNCDNDQTKLLSTSLDHSETIQRNKDIPATIHKLKAFKIPKLKNLDNSFSENKFSGVLVRKETSVILSSNCNKSIKISKSKKIHYDDKVKLKSKNNFKQDQAHNCSKKSKKRLKTKKHRTRNFRVTENNELLCNKLSSEKKSCNVNSFSTQISSYSINSPKNACTMFNNCTNESACKDRINIIETNAYVIDAGKTLGSVAFEPSVPILNLYASCNYKITHSVPGEFDRNSKEQLYVASSLEHLPSVTIMEDRINYEPNSSSDNIPCTLQDQDLPEKQTKKISLDSYRRSHSLEHGIENNIQLNKIKETTLCNPSTVACIESQKLEISLPISVTTMQNFSSDLSEAELYLSQTAERLRKSKSFSVINDMDKNMEPNSCYRSISNDKSGNQDLASVNNLLVCPSNFLSYSSTLSDVLLYPKSSNVCDSSTSVESNTMSLDSSSSVNTVSLKNAVLQDYGIYENHHSANFNNSDLIPSFYDLNGLHQIKTTYSKCTTKCTYSFEYDKSCSLSEYYYDHENDPYRANNDPYMTQNDQYMADNDPRMSQNDLCVAENECSNNTIDFEINVMDIENIDNYALIPLDNTCICFDYKPQENKEFHGRTLLKGKDTVSRLIPLGHNNSHIGIMIDPRFLKNFA